MRIFSFNQIQGRSIKAFDSAGATIASVTKGPRSWQVIALYLEPNGVLGNHKEVSDQLMLVAQGTAEVSSEGRSSIGVAQGDAVLWRSGEAHEVRAGSEGLMAIIWEGDELGRHISMPARRF
ncbi:MAG: cupin [Anaerolineae bacterium]|nr:cupin [Anaerolineae bacterium]